MCAPLCVSSGASAENPFGIKFFFTVLSQHACGRTTSFSRGFSASVWHTALSAWNFSAGHLGCHRLRHWWICACFSREGRVLEFSGHHADWGRRDGIVAPRRYRLGSDDVRERVRSDRLDSDAVGDLPTTVIIRTHVFHEPLSRQPPRHRPPPVRLQIQGRAPMETQQRRWSENTKTLCNRSTLEAFISWTLAWHKHYGAVTSTSMKLLVAQSAIFECLWCAETSRPQFAHAGLSAPPRKSNNKSCSHSIASDDRSPVLS